MRATLEELVEVLLRELYGKYGEDVSITEADIKDNTDEVEEIGVEAWWYKNREMVIAHKEWEKKYLV